MSRFTPRETALLKALLDHHRVSMGQMLKHPGTELTATGREQYKRDIEYAERLADKLTNEYHDALRIPGATA